MPLTITEMNDVLGEFNISSAVSEDEISYKWIIESGDVFKIKLLHIYNQS